MQYSQQMDQGEQIIRIGSMHLSGQTPLNPDHISQGKGAGAEGSSQIQHGSEYQSQTQHSLPKGLGGTQVNTEESYGNFTGSGSGLGDFEECGCREEYTKHEPDDIGQFATHRDVEGNRLNEMQGSGQRELGGDPPVHRVYSPAPAATGGAASECTGYGPNDIDIAAYRDIDGPYLYKMEGAGRREEGRFMRVHEGAAKHTSDMKVGSERR
ncbi:hypothetical protein L211DRAFT_852900 [Terfezia boudieri ATCC MYA-4762]|uniref:Uncharacterized protein n=1 Tax=Terfezia boudieri ATCC MYA-4762 TaxID=1051890 RepID=A0A3N4LA95_9PEZI|nr:hypothetical protein L211DRAFT_852900 [Terfezia boudieri ATCC MYA-4762]